MSGAYLSRQLLAFSSGPYKASLLEADFIATQFLGALDNDPVIGKMIDCTSDFDIEAREMMQKTGQQMTPQLYLLKMFLGAIDSSYDNQGEHIRDLTC